MEEKEQSQSATELIQSLVINSLEAKVKVLQHYYDTSQGLWCIDQNPNDVEIDWIREHCFQLT